MDNYSFLTLYLVGVVIALSLHCFELFVDLSRCSSVKAKNLKKIGVHYSFLQGGFVKRTPIAWEFFWCPALTFLLSALSWLDVGFSAWGWFSRRVNKVKTPEKLNEIIYRLSTTMLLKEEVGALYQEQMRMFRSPGPEWELVDEENLLVLVADPSYVEMRVQPSIMRYEHCFQSPDWTYSSKSVYQYKIEATKVQRRLLHRMIDEHGRELYEVRDGVVLENAIRERWKDNSCAQDTVETTIADSKESVEWHELSPCLEKYFLLSKHPNLLPAEDYRWYFRKELTRLQTGCAKIRGLAAANGLARPSDQGSKLINNLNKSAEYSATCRRVLGEVGTENFGITEREYVEGDRLEAFLLELLGDTSSPVSYQAPGSAATPK